MNIATAVTRFTPMADDIVATSSSATSGAHSDKHIMTLVEKLQRRLAAFQRHAASTPSGAGADPMPPHHHSRTASGSIGIFVSGNGSKRVTSGGPGGANTPDEVSFVFSVNDAAVHGATQGLQGDRQGQIGGPVSITSADGLYAPGDSAGTGRSRGVAVRDAMTANEKEEYELFLLAEALCTELNGGVNYRALCQQYGAALDAVTTMVRQDIAMLRSSVVLLPRASVSQMSEDVHQLLAESARLLKEAGVIDLTSKFPAVSVTTSSQPPTTVSAAAAPSILEYESEQRQVLNRVNTEPYMRALSHQGAPKRETSEAAAAATIAESESSRRASASRDVSPPPHAVPVTTASSSSGGPVQPPPPPLGAGAPPNTTRRLAHLEQLFSNAYADDADQFLRDALGVLFRYTYDVASSPAVPHPPATPQPSATHRLRASSLHSTSSVTSTPTTGAGAGGGGGADTVTSRFRAFKQHTSDVMAPLLTSYDALKEGSFDTTSLRSDYVNQCLLSQTKPHDTILALLGGVKENRGVETVALAGAKVGDAALAPFLRLLPRLHRLHTLSLPQCDLHDSTAAVLAVSARGHPSLRVVDLSRNDISDAAFDDLVSLYGAAPRLEDVNLTGCPISAYTRTQLDDVKATVQQESAATRRAHAARRQLSHASSLAPVRPRTALHAYATLKSTARRTSHVRAESVPYSLFSATAPATGVYATPPSRGTSQLPFRRGGGGPKAPAKTPSLPPIRPF